MKPSEIRKQYRQWAGTDISRDVCDAEGYMQGCWKGKWTQDTQVRLFVTHFDGSIDQEGEFSAKDIYEIYLRKKAEIDDFADCDYTAPPTNIYDMLHLASSTNAYMGIFSR